MNYLLVTCKSICGVVIYIITANSFTSEFRVNTYSTARIGLEMKIFHALAFVIKTILSVAGIVLLINKLSEKKSDSDYKFTIDSAINNDDLKACKHHAPKKKFDFADLQKSYFQSKDYF